MTSHALTWSYAFHASRRRDRRVGDTPVQRRAGDIFISRRDAGVVERSLDRLIAILTVVGVRSW